MFSNITIPGKLGGGVAGRRRANAEDNQGYIEQTSGPQIGAFLYLGAKHR